MEDWVEVFRAGDYGAKGKYTTADLDTMVTNYDPAKHEAPLVLGHPQHDAPAYGWVEKLKRVGDVLLAQLRQVSPKIEQLMQVGSFKKRSVSFYRNPLSLRHVGLLGAMVPEVKSLADVKFSDTGRETVAFDDLPAAFHRTAGRMHCIGPVSPYVPIDPASVELAEAAQELSEQEHISYGEALTRARTQIQAAQFAEQAAGGAVLNSSQLGTLCAAAAELAAKEKVSFSEAFKRLPVHE